MLTGAMALVLAAAGVFVCLRLTAELDSGIPRGLRHGSTQLAAQVGRSQFVGVAVGDPDDALASLRPELLEAAPLVLLALSVAGYAFAGVQPRRPRRQDILAPVAFESAPAGRDDRQTGHGPADPEVHAERLALGPLLERVVRRFAPEAAADGRSVQVAGPHDLDVLADPALVEEALASLVANALEHGAGSVRLYAAPRPGQIELHVTDEGAGIAEDELPGFLAGRAPEPSGLGIVAGVAAAHDGSAHAARRLDGFDVWVALPERA